MARLESAALAGLDSGAYRMVRADLIERRDLGPAIAWLVRATSDKMMTRETRLANRSQAADSSIGETTSLAAT